MKTIFLIYFLVSFLFQLFFTFYWIKKFGFNFKEQGNIVSYKENFILHQLFFTFILLICVIINIFL